MDLHDFRSDGAVARLCEQLPGAAADKVIGVMEKGARGGIGENVSRAFGRDFALYASVFAFAATLGSESCVRANGAVWVAWRLGP